MSWDTRIDPLLPGPKVALVVLVVLVTVMLLDVLVRGRRVPGPRTRMELLI
jgi:hypothetical protein